MASSPQAKDNSLPPRASAEKQRSRAGKSPASQGASAPTAQKSYESEGVRDNDIFLLPGSDYQVLALLTLLAGIVRLFRIYQPSSVVFDEVQ